MVTIKTNMSKLEEAKTHILNKILSGKVLETMEATPEDYQVLANSYSVLVQAEIQVKMSNYGMNHCPECGKHDELDTEEIG